MAERRNQRGVDERHMHAEPGATARDIAYLGLPENPEDLLRDELYPDDIYEGETYWADLPFKERSAWVNKQQRSETKQELASIWQMFKKDPLKPLYLYLRNYCVAGLGFLTEGYVIFSVGNIRALFEAVWPSCFSDYDVCNKVWVQSVSYLQIVGIICGQIFIGVIGDWIGRRWGIIQDAVTMLIGTVMLTAMWGTSLNGWVIMWAWSLYIFGVGMGGEYPMTSTTAMEGVHGQATSRNDRLHRGRSVLLAFLMQGWGQLINQGALIVFLLIFHGGGSPPYSKTATQYTFRVTFGVAVGFLVWLVYLRVYKLRNVDAARKASRQRSKVTGYDIKSLRLVSTHYWHRLFATCLCWFCNDFPFYGNQIFRNVFLRVVSSNPDNVTTTWLYNLINVGCELVGYYLAAFLIDYKHWGRKRTQGLGFIMTFVLFIIAAGAFPILNQKGAGGKAFEFIYFFSSFWIQFGPNSTTFLLAAEVYPAEIRATAHGLSAAVGKLGALAATILYNYIGDRTKFWVVCWFGLVGFILTVVFIPDTTGLDLREQERYWQCVQESREQDYHGVAIHPRHLSWYETAVLKRHLNYNPELDRKQRIDELRNLYQQMRSSIGDEKAGTDNTDALSDKISAYFEWESHRGSIEKKSLDT